MSTNAQIIPNFSCSFTWCGHPSHQLIVLPLNMYKGFPLMDICPSHLIRVIAHMPVDSFCRLRQTCKFVQCFVESHNKHIAVFLKGIDISPQYKYARKNTNEIVRLQNELRFTSPEQVIFKIWIEKGMVGHTKYMTLPEAREKLGMDYLAMRLTHFMDPNVFIEYMEFIRQQHWCTRAASSYCTPLEIFDIIKPRMLKKSVKTVEIGRLANDRLPNIRAISRHVKNLLLRPSVIADYEYYLPSLIMEVTLAFYHDELPVAYIQLTRLFFRNSTIVHISNPYGKTVAATILNLERIPYEDNQIEPSHSEFIRSHRSSAKKRGTIASTSLVSKSGARGFLAVRADVIFTTRTETDDLEVSLYLWKDPPEDLYFIQEQHEMESTDITPFFTCY